MVDYRSRSRRVLALLTRTPPAGSATLQGKLTHGTLMAIPSPSGTFWLLSLQDAPDAPCVLTLEGAEIALPPATPGGALWCALLLAQAPQPGTAVAVRCGTTQVAQGRLQ